MNKSLISLMFVLMFVMGSCGVEDEDVNTKIEGSVCNVNDEEKAVEGMVFLCQNGSWKLIRKTIFAVPNIGSEGATDLKVDDDGNIYIAGYTHNELEGYKNLGERDAILIKMDNELNILWQYQWGTGEKDINSTIYIDKEKNIYAAGSTDDNRGYSDLFITKINNRGEEVWTKLIETDHVDSSHSISVDKNGNIFLLWMSLFTAIVSKLNKEFEEVWRYEYRSDVCNYRGVSLELDNNDNFFISYYQEKYEESCQEKTVIVKRDNNGEGIWSSSRDHYDNIYSRALAVDSEGNSILIGDFVGSLDPDKYENKGSNDFFILKYSEEGKKEWEKYWGTAKFDSPDDLTIDKSGNIFVSISSSYYEYINKYNKDGDLLWSKMWCENQDVFVKSIAVDDNGNLFVLGNSEIKIDGLYPGPDNDYNIFISKWYLND